MGLLNPGALIYLAIIPALLLAYLVRERPMRATVSSVLAFRALRALKPERPAGWPKLNWLFLLEVLILGLAVLAMAHPFTAGKRRPVAIVLDNSASMQAKMPSGQTRFDAARSRLAAMLSGEGTGDEVSFYLSAPHPHLVSSTQTSEQARSA